jgi:hypothetical protein
MATVVRKNDPNVAVWCAAHNALKAQIGAGASFHLDASESTVVAATATDLPTALTMVNNIVAALAFHAPDLLALKVADTVMAAALPVVASAVDLATGITAMNAAKAAYNTHRVSTTYHYNTDATNTLATADATDLASLITLANAAKTAIVAHLASAPACASLRAVAL